MKDHPLSKEPRYLLYSSWLTSLSVYYAYKNGYYLKCLSTSILLFTSINHWRKPEFGPRRSIDKLVVKINIPIGIVSFRNSKRYREYLGLICLAACCYPISNKIKNKKTSMFVHSLIHVIANYANCLAMNS